MIQQLNYRGQASTTVGNHVARFPPDEWRSRCPFCGTALQKRYSVNGFPEFYTHERFNWDSWVCLACSWWWEGTVPEHSYSVGDICWAVLHQTAVPQALEDGIAEVQARADKLFSMAPGKFEHFIGSLLREFLACEVVHCGKSHDGGIDLMVLDSDAGHIPVQVKRRGRPDSVESVSLVREFRGAMVLAGKSRGKIATTADHFSPRAVQAACAQEQHLVAQDIDLLDCRRLLDIMSLVALNRQASVQPLRSRHTAVDLTPNPETQAKIERELEAFARQCAECS